MYDFGTETFMLADIFNESCGISVTKSLSNPLKSLWKSYH